MSKDKQNVYRAMLHGLMELSDEFLIPQVPTTDGNWLYDVFFQLRLDHPEIFWAVGFKYRYYKDSPNLNISSTKIKSGSIRKPWEPA